MWVEQVAYYVCFVAAIAFLVLAAVRGVRRRRHYEQRIRDWARQKGYAILSIRDQGRLFQDFAALVSVFWFFGPRFFRVFIQDDMGGQTTVMIYFESLNAPLDVRS